MNEAKLGEACEGRLRRTSAVLQSVSSLRNAADMLESTVDEMLGEQKPEAETGVASSGVPDTDLASLLDTTPPEIEGQVKRIHNSIERIYERIF